MVLQHSSIGKSLLWHISYNFAQCQSSDFPAVISSFISCFTTFYCIDPYFIFTLTFKKILVEYIVHVIQKAAKLIKDLFATVLLSIQKGKNMASKS